MASRTVLMTWQEGQTFTVFEFGAYGDTSSRNLIVTNNGMVWSATWGRRPLKLPEGTKYWSRSALVMLSAEYRLPLVWARKAAKGKPDGEIVSTQAGKTAHSETRTYWDRSPGYNLERSVTYTGFTSAYAKRSAHSLDQLTKLIEGATFKCGSVWDWVPRDLEVRFHDKSKSFGLAYNPGSKVHKISLNVRLLEAYDAESVWRVIVHELCHHYRDERFPINRFNPHDHIFCRELQRVDEVIAEKGERACALFVDEVDESLVASLNVRRGRKEPIWSPDAGVLAFKTLKSGKLRFLWQPNPPNKWTVVAEPVNDDAVLRLVKQFAPKDYERVQVFTINWGAPDRFAPPKNLLVLLQYMMNRWGHQLTDTGAYLKSVIDTTKGTPL